MSRTAPPVDIPTRRRKRTPQRSAFLATMVGRGYAAADWAQGIDFARTDGPPADAVAVLTDRATGTVHPVTVETMASGLWRLAQGRIRGIGPSHPMARRLWHINHDNDTATVTDRDADAVLQAGLFGALRYGRVAGVAAAVPAPRNPAGRRPVPVVAFSDAGSAR